MGKVILRKNGVETQYINGGLSSDNILNGTEIEIRVYP